MRSDTGASAGWRARRSSQRIDASRIETGEIGDETCLVFEAAQIENERLVLDASDHRNRQRTQRGRERLQRPAAARARAESKTGAG